MNTLERASRELVDEPVRDPTPISAIERRAAQLRRRRGTAIASVAAMFMIVVLVGVALARTSPATHVSTESPPVQARGALTLGPGTSFIPPTHADGDQTRLPITLANGDTIELGYPTDLDLAGLGFVPGTGIRYEPSPDAVDCCSRTVEIRHGTVADVFAGLEPQKSYPGSGGNSVLYFTGTDINYLAFQIGDWVVAVPDYEATGAEANNTAMTDAQRATYAANLTGQQTPEGYLILTPKPPLSLAYTDTPSGAFGDGDLGLVYRACTSGTQPVTDTHGFTLEGRDPESGTWLCYARIPIVVHVGGSEAFQVQVANQLQIIANHQSAYG